MPLIRVDMIKGRSPEAIKELLDAAHRAALAAFKVPLRDRYQIVNEYDASHFIMEDTGLGIPRTQNCVIFEITTRPHEKEAKENFYKILVRELETTCGIAPSDVMISIVTNSDEDWSFGYGHAQYLTGELASGRRAA